MRRPITGERPDVHFVGYCFEPEQKQYDCPICQDRGIVIEIRDGEPVGVPCLCKERKRIARKLRASGLTAEQMKYKIGDYRRTEENKNLLEGTLRYLKVWPSLVSSDSPAKGFCMIGSVGIGKTMLSCIIARDILAKSVPVVFIPSSDLIAELRQAQFQNDGNGMEEKIDTLSKVKALILDDIGKEKPTEWVQSVYYRLIDLRYRNNLLTGFTSNYSLEELEERLGEYGSATVSRLISMAKKFILTGSGKDMRL